MIPSLQERVRGYLQRLRLLSAGDAVAVAVSGGADSVALLRLLLELRRELGLVLSVVHFNHHIRGAEADADEDFVGALAANFGLPFHHGSGDVPAHAVTSGLSLEAAARELRYRYFGELLEARAATRIATAHTLDDQAETVLLRLLRGAWTQGLAGIYPEVRSGNRMGAVVRPLLELQRHELLEYLRAVGQEWREDASNLNLKHTRNRVRHRLLPLLESEFNPGIRAALAETAEIARAEEEYWSEQLDRSGGLIAVSARTGGASLSAGNLRCLPLAQQRRALRAEARKLGLRLNFQQVERILRLLQAERRMQIELPQGWRAQIGPSNAGSSPAERFLLFVREPDAAPPSGAYEYLLRVPGQVAIARAGVCLRALLVGLTDSAEQPSTIDNLLAIEAATSSSGGGLELRVRNWRAGDRFWPVHTKSPKKVKELLQARHISGVKKEDWPVAVGYAGELVWMRGFGVSQKYAAGTQGGAAILLEEGELHSDP